MRGKKTGGGSRKGKPNRAKVAFRDALEAYCDAKGFSPFHTMVDIACDPTIIDQHLRFQAAKEVAQYLAPKLRSIELTSDTEHPLQVFHTVILSLNEALVRAYEPPPPRVGAAPALVALPSAPQRR